MIMSVSKKVSIILLTFAAVVALPGVVSAHVVVRPETVDVGAYQTFTTGVPNEKDVPVTEMRLTIPSDVQHVTPTVKPGWDISTKKTGDTITEISWTGGLIPVGQRDEFSFSAQAPAAATTLQWKAYQSYADGSMVSWDQAPTGGHDDDKSSDKGSYSTTKVINDLAVADSDKASDSTKLQGAYIIAMVALGLSLVALVLRRKR